MVVFTCNHCGESVRKTSVEKHYNMQCRGIPKSVSCMDCQIDFRNEEYVAHIKCITEAEKYSGKDYVPKETKNSGAKKQENWMDIIRSILDSDEYKLNQQSLNAFQRLQNIDNVPRKKVKFQNFAFNCLRLPKAQSEVVWSVLERELEKMKQAKQVEITAAKVAQETARNANTTKVLNGVKRPHPEQNGHDEPTKEKKVKRTISVGNGDAGAAGAEKMLQAEEFQWQDALQKFVAKNDDGISVEKLKKKLLKKYSTKLGLESLTEKEEKKLGKKFAKNLKKCSNLRIEDGVVKLC